MLYDNLSEYERALARFGDKCGILASLEISNKISPEDAYQQIKELYKELKSLRKQEKSEWNTPN
jgi:transcription elongation factor Elf1